jgi:hypothetical protein
MKKITLIAASLLLVVSSAVGYAGPRGGGGTKGASGFSPGDQMKDLGTKTTRGASEFSPGDQMKDLGTKTTKGASEFTPGDKMIDLRKK